MKIIIKDVRGCDALEREERASKTICQEYSDNNIYIHVYRSKSVGENKMKIWNSFGSAHSANITIIGEFKEGTDIDLAEKIIKDFTDNYFQRHYKNIQEFCNAWKEKTDSNIYVYCPFEDEFETGINDNCVVAKERDKIIVSRFSSENIGGIIKLMRMFDPKEIKITEPPKR